MKELSVIIVNYNVSHFLEQALQSVRKAMELVDGEIFVVDNNSVDGSVEMVRSKFPEVILIANKNNVGFARANNQAIKEAKGKYVLLLNPDTVVEEDTFSKVVSFMNKHPEAGGLGVKMLDGKGDFLPESKRGFPSPSVAFYKMFGLAKLFPKSRRFGRYHLGFLDKDSIHQVDVLSGACMFLRKEALDKTGLLDEDYFMYGEDIDLSYRIFNAGYKNYYFPETRIIHYKGESTKKTSINYVFIFYRAMIIFAHKHLSSRHAGLFSFLINIAIYIRAGIAVAENFIKKAYLPLLDAAVIYAGMYFLKNYWEKNHLWSPVEYPPEYMIYAVPAYILMWLLAVFFNGGYDRPVRPGRIIRGLFIGTVIIAAVSYFLKEYQFSRALILMGGIWACFALTTVRFAIHLFRFGNLNLGEDRRKRVVIVGQEPESNRIYKLLNEGAYRIDILGFVTPRKTSSSSDLFLGNIAQIKEIIDLYHVDEIIFCSKDVPANNIIKWMTSINNRILDYKVVPAEGNYIIGSNSKNKPGEFYTVNIDLNIIRKEKLRTKRAFDIASSLIMLLLSPVLMWFMRNPLKFLSNIFKVLSGKCTWVGFSYQNQLSLPKLRKGIISPISYLNNKKKLDTPTVHRLDMLYARDYNLYMDIELLFRSFRKLG